MAKKTYLGIDIGQKALKLALVSGGTVLKTAMAEVPDNLVRDGRVVSIETMAELIRAAMKDHNIRCKDAAVIMSGSHVFVKTAVMPLMTPEQLAYNLPFEFRDYTTEDNKKYIYDYAMISRPGEAVQSDTADEPSTDVMELLAVAVPEEWVEDLRLMLRKAGLRLAKAAPAIYSYIPLIRARRRARNEEDRPGRETCILNIGFHAVNMNIYEADRHKVSRILDIGLQNAADAVAREYNVDAHLAYTYLTTNYDDCQMKAGVQAVFSSIAVELMRAVNFYRFSNPDSSLEDVYICGGGSFIRPLLDQIRETVDLNIYSAAELLPGNDLGDDAALYVPAVGIALDD